MKSAPKWLNNPGLKKSTRAWTDGEEGNVEGEVSADEAALQYRDDRSHRPRQDDVDGGDHQGLGGEGRGDVCAVRPDRQGAGRTRARDHDCDGACRVRDRQAALCACRLPGSCRLHQEHDHRGGADGRRDPGGVGGRRPDAADPRARAVGAPGRGAGVGRVHEQGRHGGRPGIARPGRAGGPRAAVELSVSG